MGTGKRILVVEDEPQWRQVIVNSLHPLNLEVHTATNLHEAKTALTQYSYDGLIVDIRLNPNDDADQGGVNVIRQARQYDSHTPIIVITASANSDLKERLTQDYQVNEIFEKVELTQPNFAEDVLRHRLAQLIGVKPSDPTGGQDQTGRQPVAILVPQSPAGRKSKTARSVKRRESYRILLAEDIQQWQKVIGDLLEQEGYAVSCVEGYTEARGQLNRAQYDLALVDLRLKDISGSENPSGGAMLIEDILSQLNSVPIIIISAYLDDPLAQSWLAKGVQDVFSKATFRKDKEQERFKRVVREVLQYKYRDFLMCREAFQKALHGYKAGYSAKQLGKNPLTDLELFGVFLEEERGEALQKKIAELLSQYKERAQNSDEFKLRSSVVFEYYIDGKEIKEITKGFSISRRTFYNKRERAIDDLVTMLLDQEQDFKRSRGRK